MKNKIVQLSLAFSLLITTLVLGQETTFTRIKIGAIVNDGGNSLGCAWGDYDKDGDLDLFVANRGEKINCLYQYENKGFFTKTDIFLADTSNSIGCTWGDYNNDGNIDLFVTNDKAVNLLYQNKGDATFTTFIKITTGLIVNEYGTFRSCNWGDYDNDGNLDLFVAGISGHNLLYRNNASNGSFTRIDTGLIVTDSGNSYGSNWVDYDDDGDIDLFVANLGQNNFLYQNDGQGNFLKVTDNEIVNDSADSWGGSWGDYDNDGDLDLFVTNDGNNFLYNNQGGGKFLRVTEEPFLSDGGSSRGSSWGDYDNDGDLDLFVANNGTKIPEGENNFLYRNNGNGTFSKITTGEVVSDGGVSEGCSWADYDNDGDLDLFVTNNGVNFLYRNDGNDNNWINIHLIGAASNYSAIGAKIRVKAWINGKPVWQLRDISGQTGYLSQNSLNAELGLGKASIADSIHIEWPLGAVNMLTTVKADTFISLRENNRPRFQNEIKYIVLSSDSSFMRNLNAEPIFVDIDGDTLNYTVSCNNPDIAKASIAGDTLTVSVISDTALGRATVTIIADDQRVDDNKGNTEEIMFDINRPPLLLQNIPDTSLSIEERVLRFDLSTIFMDPERDSLTFEVDNSDETVALAAISKQSLLIVALSSGNTQITLTARDQEEGNTDIQFMLSVTLGSSLIFLHDPDQIGIIDLDQAVEIRMAIEDDDNLLVDNPFLYYRQAGTPSFSRVEMTSCPDMRKAFCDTLPSSIVTNQGVEYFFEAIDRISIRWRYPLAGSFCIRVNVARGVNHTLPGGEEKSSYQLFSVPLDLDNKSPSAVLRNLGSYDPLKWRFYELVTDTVTLNTDYEASYETASFEPGKAFWLIVKKSSVINTGPGTTIFTSEPYPITLRRGWNFVGNPFNFDAVAEDPMSGFASLRFYEYEFGNGWSSPKLITNEQVVLQSFSGYAVYADPSRTLFINPDRFRTGEFIVKPKIETNKKLCAIQILAQCQGAQDRNNIAVIDEHASQEWDESDHPEPPVIGEYVSIYFPHHDWKSFAKTYCIDARPEPTEGEVWEFEVKTNILDKVNLTFEEIESVPEAFEVWLVDEAVSIAQNLRENNSYSVAGRGPEHPKSLKLVVGKSDFIAKKLTDIQLIPTTYELSQNFPNPFNPATAIRYGLPREERVTLQVYNLLGEEVVTLMDDEHQIAGYHVAIWDGRNKAGHVVSSGVYVYRIRAGVFTMTKKMALVK